MDRQQFESLRVVSERPEYLRVEELDEGPDKTLAFGYTLTRKTWHLYVEDDELHLVEYDYSGTLLYYLHGTALLAEECVPSKRLYPELTDFEYAVLMKRKGVELPFTTFSDIEDRGEFAGRRVQELKTR